MPDIVNEYLDRCIVQNELPEKSLYSAMRYSLMAGGKRLRPVLSLAVCDMLGGSVEQVLPFACAVEMIIHILSYMMIFRPWTMTISGGQAHKSQGIWRSVGNTCRRRSFKPAFEIMLENIIKTVTWRESQKRRQ